jgi:hypothetical protein
MGVDWFDKADMEWIGEARAGVARTADKAGHGTAGRVEAGRNP